MPTARNGRACALRSDQYNPATQMGVSARPVKMICASQYVARLWPACICRTLKTAMLGQPCTVCQIRSGAASTAAITPPTAR